MYVCSYHMASHFSTSPRFVTWHTQQQLSQAHRVLVEESEDLQAIQLIQDVYSRHMPSLTRNGHHLIQCTNIVCNSTREIASKFTVTTSGVYIRMYVCMYVRAYLVHLCVKITVGRLIHVEWCE